MCAGEYKGELVSAKSKSPENTEKNDESDDLTVEDIVETGAESSDEEPILIEGEATEVEETTSPEGAEHTSDDESESFPPEAAAVVEKKRGSFIPGFLGGLIAAAMMFGGVYYFFQDRLNGLGGIDTNSAGLAELTTKVEELGASIPTVPPPVDTSGLESSIATLENSVAAISTDVSTLQNIPPVDLSGLTADIQSLAARVGDLELEEGNADSAQADAAVEQLAAFKTELDQLVADAEAKVAEAEANIADAETKAAEVDAAASEAAAKAEAAAQLAELKSAIEGGAPYDDLISGLDDVPAELVAHADSGVPALSVLQQQFPNAARAAVGAVQIIPEDASTGEKLTAFLRRQTNARSLAPKDGDGPDAVLSRAEALLTSGDLDAALSEIANLPEDAQNAMTAWLTGAKTRQSALQSINALSAEMN